jgi:hypothetical protein
MGPMASSDRRDRYVLLKNGLALPLEPLLLALELEERGLRLSREGADTLVVQPHHHLTHEDRERIRRWKFHLLSIVDYQAPERVQ